MTKSEALEDINGTIGQIREYANRYADSGMEAEYVAGQIETWLDQLRRDIEVYNEAEDDEEEE